MSRKSFYILDGHAQIFRAYYAPFRDLTSPTGEPTKATYVFTKMLLNLIDLRKPDYLAMVIDSGEQKVFRKEIFPAYKANRKSPPDDFRPQAGRILRIVADAGVPLFVKPGFEADDLIATMADRLAEREFDVFMVSKDKDLRQLVTDHIVMYDVQADEVLDAGGILAKCGYTPAQSVEVQTLMGDATDNVPGIPGVGEKIAVKLIEKYGSADALLDHLDELTPKLRENVVANADKLKLSRQLVTLRRDVPFEFDPDACRFTGLDAAGLRGHLEELGFTNLLKRLGPAPTPDLPRPSPNAPSPASGAPRPSSVFSESLFGGPPAAASAPRPSGAGDADDADAPPPASVPLATGESCDYRLIATETDFADFLVALQSRPRFAFDTETRSLGAVSSPLVGMSFSWAAGTGFYVPVDGPEGSSHLSREQVLRDLKPLLEDEAIQKVGHNIKYDLLAMRQAGVTLRGIALDSMIAMFLLDAGRIQYGMDSLARDLLGFQKIPTVDLLGKGKNQITMDRVELARLAAYAAEDADITWRLCEQLGPKLDQSPALRRLHDDIERPLIAVLADMEHNGIAVDPDILRAQGEVLGERIELLRAKVIEAAGTDFNPDSPKQLGEVLFDKLKLRVVKRNKTGPSTDVMVLEALAAEHPVPRLILEYRSLVKLKNTYLDSLGDSVNPATGRIHTSFNQTGAATGRLSSSDPNLQNIPIRTDEGRRIRLAFVPGDRANNVLLTLDYSQVELRVLAHFTREPALVAAFEADEDIHRTVAAEVFGVPVDEVTRDQRGQAKTINFGIIYGVSAFGLARRIEGMSVAAAGDLIAAYNRRFPTIAGFLDNCVRQARDLGYVQTILGRRRPIPNIDSGVISVRNGAERMAINSVVQGSAADLIKLAMLDVHRRLAHENPNCKMLLQVHDELVFETPAATVEADAEIVRQEMIAAGAKIGLTIPLKVEAGWGKNWQEVK